MSAKKAETVKVEKVNPRFIKRGDIIQQEGIEGSEVVRDISIILHMANGMDVIYKANATVDRVPPEDLSDLVAVIESTDDETT